MIGLNSIEVKGSPRRREGEIILSVVEDNEALEDICDCCHKDADRLRRILIVLLQHTPPFAPKQVNDCAGLQLDVTG